MIQFTNENIASYLRTISRNKIVIHSDAIKGISSINIGKSLASEIGEISLDKHYTLKAKNKLEDILTRSIIQHPEFGRTLAISNIGILFEPELKIDFPSIIEKYSKDMCLFIQWEGNIEDTKLHFLTKEKGIEINIKNLSHIII